jgi:2-oxoglutarate dehydrogenase E2 component (dihydrolipoamide succinyltransferase)
MAEVKMVMPKMGESIMEGTVLNWLKKVGDAIAQDESVLEVATDKVDTEVPATHAGTLKEILVKEGDVVAVGAAIAIIETDASAAASAPAPVTAVATPAPAAAVAASAETPAGSGSTVGNGLLPVGIPGRFYSPLVMNMAREEGISMADLERIPGTGADGRVSKKDMLSFVEYRKTAASAPAPVVATPVAIATPIAAPVQAAVTNEPAPARPAMSVSGEHDIIEMDRMRKMIAQRMIDSKRISPHVTSFVEADVTNLVHWRNKIKKDFERKEGEAITFTPMFIEAVVKAIKDYPMINVSVDGDKIIVKKFINIGMAVALPSGNLIVPTIKNADQLNLVGITKKVNDLSNRARLNKLKPADLEGGTFSISNIGSSKKPN